MSETKPTAESLKKDLALAEKNITNPAVKGNAVLSKSLQNKIDTLKEQVRVAEGGAPAEEKKEVAKASAPAKVQASAKKIEVKKQKAKKEPKVAKEKKEKKEKAPAKVIKTKEGLKVNGFEAGNKVSFIERVTGKKTIGVITKIELTGDKQDYNAYILHNSIKQKVRLGKLSKA